MHDKAFSITKNPKFDGFQSLPSMVHGFFYYKSSGDVTENGNISDQQLAEELHKTIIKQFKKRKLHSFFIGNICCADPSNMK